MRELAQADFAGVGKVALLIAFRWSHWLVAAVLGVALTLAVGAIVRWRARRMDYRRRLAASLDHLAL